MENMVMDPASRPNLQGAWTRFCPNAFGQFKAHIEERHLPQRCPTSAQEGLRRVEQSVLSKGWMTHFAPSVVITSASVSS